MSYINLWTLENIDLPSYSFQHKTITTTFSEKLNTYFYSHFSDYFDFKTKLLGKDFCVPTEINILPLPCDSYTTLCFYIKTLDKELYDFCISNNIKILICLTRETIESHEYDEIDSLLSFYWKEKGIKPDNTKILVNSFEPLTKLKFSEYFISYDLFKYFTRNYNKTLATTKNSIKLSVFGGTLLDRPYRVLFFSELVARGMLPDLFYTNIVTDPIELEKNIYSYFHVFNYEEQLKIVSSMDILLKPAILDKNGYLTSDNIYNNGDELIIPPQLNNSIVSVALETRNLESSITEKLYKILRVGSLPLWHGSINIKNYLSNQGFLFSDKLDYSFDTLTNPKSRLYALCDEIERILYLPVADLEHEKNKYYEQNIKTFFTLTDSMDERLFTFNNL